MANKKKKTPPVKKPAVKKTPVPKTASQKVDEAQKVSKTFAPINTTDRQAKSSFLATARRRATRRLSLRRLVLSLGFIVLVTVGGILLFDLFSQQNNGSATNQIRSAFSGEELKDYTSPENKFTILMPGLPTISKSNGKSDGKDIPITTYERVIENGSKNYTFAVFNYGDVQLDEPKALEAALNNALQNTPGAEIVSAKPGKYGELNALEAAYNVSDKEKVYESHIRYVIKGSVMYAMILIGSDQATFDHYANSLRLN